MFERLGTDGFTEELCKGFSLLMDKDKGVITFQSLKSSAESLWLQEMTDEEIACMLSPDLMQTSKQLLVEAFADEFNSTTNDAFDLGATRILSYCTSIDANSTQDHAQGGNKSEAWKPPTNGWIKINIDVAFKDNSAAAAMASTHAKECNWKNIIWVTDAKEVANTVLEASAPANWNSWYEIQSLKERFLREDWILEWNNREANCVADLGAKYTLQHKTWLRCDEFFLSLLPKYITDRIQLERLALAV
ncbi:hypothetical protein FNV43_RR07694 [Rhamnella rubrinervis]|uniref:RNase H type-1 domain-containing protein n=1 Tax=Rhamnella rubrinervis TaxID=2594499 RepID=A0A8K0HG86_9ROSA|nr:hypothetical protein FNV43_RR07694 [Rhamnella rubrinervis]